MRKLAHGSTIDAMNTHTLTWTLADAVVKMRTEAGMDQSQLADASGVSRSSISNYERGESAPPNFATIRRIARACGFEHDDDELHQLWTLARSRPDGPPLIARYMSAA